jgi:hypothetical protein
MEKRSESVKDGEIVDTAISSPSESATDEALEENCTTIPTASNRLQKFANKLDLIAGFEARGIERVPESMRKRKPAARDYLQMLAIWFSANCTANALTVGILGPVAYGLGLTDAML